jgi:hypothetical protein
MITTNTQKKLSVAIAGLLFLGSAASAQVISEDFSSPLKVGSGGANAELGNGSSYTFASWVYSNGNGGIDDDPEGTGTGVDFNNDIATIGQARAQAGRGSNARAASVIFDGSAFTAGQEYTVSFDVIGDAAGSDTGRYWLAEVSGYDSDDGISIDGTQAGWGGGQKPFTVSGLGGDSVVNFLADSAANGVLLDGETVASTSVTSFDFTYSAGTDIAFAVGTYNNIFAIDNFQIGAVPEPSSYAFLVGCLTFVSVMICRRR